MSRAQVRPRADVSGIPTGRVLEAGTSFGRRDEAGLTHGLEAQSASMRRLVHSLERLAPRGRATLITGAPGTGKGLVADIVHRLGPCRGAGRITWPGVGVTEGDEVVLAAACGAATPVTCIVPELVDLTDARQAVLIRALDQVAGRMAGEGLHVIAATSVDLASAVTRGEVRADLVYRLGVVRLHVPSLDERREDLPGLASCFLREACRTFGIEEKTWSGAAREVLQARRWPGNARQLRNVVLRAAALTDDRVIGAHTVREACAPDDTDEAPQSGGHRRGGDERDRQRVSAALHAAGGNKSVAAASLGVSRRAFYRMLDRLGA